MTITEMDASVETENIDSSSKKSTGTDYNFPQSQQYQEKYMKSALQRHCAFFDRDRDGIISLMDTFRGFIALGFNIFIAFWGTIFIHLTLAYQTYPTIIPSLTLPIYLNRIHKSQHGSDTKTYDHLGKLQTNMSLIQTNFIQFDTNKKGGLTYLELLWMLWSIKSSYDPFGLLMGLFWWTCLYFLAADRNGILSLEAITAQFDGSLFYMIENDRKREIENNSKLSSKDKKIV